MRKIYFIPLVILFLLGGGIFLYWLSRSTPPSEPLSDLPPFISSSSSAPISSSPLPSSSSSDILTLGTPSGVVSLRDFRPNAVDHTTLGDSYTLFRGQEFSVEYIGESSSFLLDLYALPFNEVRFRAEQKLLSLLAVSQSDLCRLSIVARMRYAVDPDHALVDWPLSFCVGR